MFKSEIVSNRFASTLSHSAFVMPVTLRTPLLATATLLLTAVTGLACGDDPVALVSPIEWADVETPVGTIEVALVRPDNEGAEPHPVLLALPWGAGTPELADAFVRRYWAEEPAARGYYVVSPAVYGPSLMDDADAILDALFAWMDANLDADLETVALVGASNGGRGAFHAAIADPERFDAMLVLPGQYTGDASNLAGLAGMPIRMIVGEFDSTWVNATRATEVALESVGIMPTVDIAGAQGHVMDLLASGLVGWIDESLGR